MRVDGRVFDALRPVSMERGFTKHTAGSVLVSFGDTKVICTASLESRVPPWMRGKGRGWVTAEYAMLPGSAQDRISRDASRKGRAQEISRLIGRSLRAVTDLEAMGECMVTVDCDVIQADGGTRTASITGAYVALWDAFDQSVRRGNIGAVPLHGQCAAVSVGLVAGEALLDLNYQEDFTADVDMNIVMDSEERYIEVQGSAENAPFSKADLQSLLALGEKGAGELVALQREVLGLG
jgi:ribonuclease PH